MFNQRFVREYEDIRIVKMGEDPVGIYQLEADGETLRLVRLILRPRYQRLGIGGSILDAVIVRGEKWGFRRITLSVWENNPAMAFYQEIRIHRIRRRQNP